MSRSCRALLVSLMVACALSLQAQEQLGKIIGQIRLTEAPPGSRHISRAAASVFPHHSVYATVREDSDSIAWMATPTTS